MAILFITHKYPPATGGMEKQSFELINGYSKREKTYSIIYDQKINIIIFFLQLRKKVYDLLRNHPEIKIIHLNDGLMASFFYLLCIKPNGRKVAVTIHGLDIVFPFWAYQKLILKGIKKYDAFICVSQATKAECQKRDFNNDKLKVISNGVNSIANAFTENSVAASRQVLQKYGIDPEDDKIVLAIGRPIRRKGFSWFAENVMPLLGADYKFLHIGDISCGNPPYKKILPQNWSTMINLFLGYKDDCVALTNIAKRNKNIILTGKIPDIERNILLQNALFVILPNIKVEADMEGFGLVALEASILGKTVLASDIDGITDAVHNHKNGYLLASGNAVEWSEKIKELSPVIPHKDKNISQYTAEHFSWNKMIDGYQSVFSGLV